MLRKLILTVMNRSKEKVKGREKMAAGRTDLCSTAWYNLLERAGSHLPWPWEVLFHTPELFFLLLVSSLSHTLCQPQPNNLPESILCSHLLSWTTLCCLNGRPEEVTCNKEKRIFFFHTALKAGRTGLRCHILLGHKAAEGSCEQEGKPERWSSSLYHKSPFMVITWITLQGHSSPPLWIPLLNCPNKNRAQSNHSNLMIKISLQSSWLGFSDPVLLCVSLTLCTHYLPRDPPTVFVGALPITWNPCFFHKSVFSDPALRSCPILWINIWGNFCFFS